MDNSRNYILDRITSKKVSIDEFNFDKLQAPPLAMFFSPFDIQELHSIATSIKYAANPKARYDAIDHVCRRNGLTKFGAGTNRVVYRHPEFPDILFKIAADDIGLGDNPAEFRNQFILKPFVNKIFEISPCGTVALVEKVNPITSREEFISVADDVFELLTTWILGKYIMQDISSSHFCNYGVRKGFGIVLLDYPYLYELDGDKLYCNRPDSSKPEGICGGEIDYDNGFKNIVCTCCGKIYHARELEKKIKDNEIIKERQGEFKMNIKVSGGSKNVNTVVSTESVHSNLFKPTKNSVTTNVGDKIDKAKNINKVSMGSINNEVNDVPSLKVKKNVSKPAIEEPAIVEVEAKEEEVVEEAVVVDTVKVDPVIKYVNGVSTSKADMAESPISFFDRSLNVDESVPDFITEAPKKGPVEIIDDAMNTILNTLDDINIDNVKEDCISRIIDKIGGVIDPTSVLFAKLMSIVYRIFKEADEDEYVKMVNNDEFVKIVDSIFVPDIELISAATNENGGLDVNYKINTTYAYDTSIVALATNEEVFEISNIASYIPTEDESDGVAEVEAKEEEVVEEAAAEDEQGEYPRYNGFMVCEAKKINIKDIFPSVDSMEIMALVDYDTNDYIAIDNVIVAVDVIDDQEVKDISVVSKDWLDQTIKCIESQDEEEVDIKVEETVVESTGSTGVLPPSQTVEEFLANEEVEKVEV